MHRYQVIEKSPNVVRDRIETGLSQARLTYEVLSKRWTDFSSFRVCSFEFDGEIHLEVRWDWKTDGLLIAIGPCGPDAELDRHYAVKGVDIPEAIEAIALTIVYMCEREGVKELTACMLGE